MDSEILIKEKGTVEKVFMLRNAKQNNVRKRKKERKKEEEKKKNLASRNRTSDLKMTG